jgi:hypothetical protein
VVTAPPIGSAATMEQSATDTATADFKGNYRCHFVADLRSLDLANRDFGHVLPHLG